MRLYRTVCFLLCVSITLVAAAQEQVALITEVSGEVFVRHTDGSRSQAKWGEQLHAGDVVETGAAASASILFANRSILSMVANSEMEIAGTQSSSRSVDPSLLADVSDLTLHRTGVGEIAALGGLRAGTRQAVIAPLSPRNTRVRSDRPHFSWTTTGDFDSYTVTVLGDEGAVWTSPAGAMGLQYPSSAPELTPGETYFWRVDGEDMLDVVSSGLSSFSVLSNTQREAITAGETQITALFTEGQRDATREYMLGALYAKQGLVPEAIVIFESISESHEGSAFLHEILAKLYLESGQKDRAIASLQKAVEFAQSK